MVWNITVSQDLGVGHLRWQQDRGGGGGGGEGEGEGIHGCPPF